MSPKRFLRRRFASANERLSTHRLLSWLGAHRHAAIWHFGRRQVAGGVSLGLFLAFIPIPIQMFCAAIAAVVLRVNLPLAFACVWITNPLTAAPLYLFAYKVGAWITGATEPIWTKQMEWSIPNVIGALDRLGYPLLVGCVICGAATAAIGNMVVRWLWTLMVLYRWRRRRRLRDWGSAR